MRTASLVISITLLLSFVYNGYQAGWFTQVGGWPPETRALLFLGRLIAWIARNEFEGRG